MKYKIEPEDLSYVIYRKRGLFSKWERVGRTVPLFDIWSMKAISSKDFKEIRKRVSRHLKEIKEMDKILVGKHK